MIRFSEEIRNDMICQAKKEYPNECCGVLLGTRSGQDKLVIRQMAVCNLADQGSRNVYFRMSPLEILRMEQFARAEQLQIIGFYHSHPDHAAEASAEDVRHMIPGLSYPILSIGSGDLAEIRSYEKTRFENIDAKEEEIVIRKECKNSILEDDGSSYADGFPGGGKKDAQPHYAPSVISQKQAASAQDIQVRTTHEDQNVIPAKDAQEGSGAGKVGGQKHNDQIVVGTKTLEQIRWDFPILRETVNGHPLIWLDNGATTQRPQAVIDRLSYYYEHENSNVHRGAHTMAARSTDAFEGARQIVADFIGAPSKDNIIFVRGTTEGINLVAQSYVKPLLNPGDEIIVSLLEHHANIVPWQLIAQETGTVIKVIPVDKDGQLILSEYEKLFTKKTKFVSVTHVSNVLGTITPVAELVAIAHRHGVRILIDGAQSITHRRILTRWYRRSGLSGRA